VHLTPLPEPAIPRRSGVLKPYCSCAFNQRRKMLRSALKGAAPDIRGPFAGRVLKADRNGRNSAARRVLRTGPQRSPRPDAPLSLAFKTQKVPHRWGPLLHVKVSYSAAFGRSPLLSLAIVSVCLGAGCGAAHGVGLGLFLGGLRLRLCSSGRRHLLAVAVRLGALSFWFACYYGGAGAWAHLRYRCCPAVG